MGDLAGLLTPARRARLRAGAGRDRGGREAPAGRREFGIALAGGVLGVLAVVAVIAFLSRSGHGADGGWGFIVPALIIWRSWPDATSTMTTTTSTVTTTTSTGTTAGSRRRPLAAGPPAHPA